MTFLKLAVSLTIAGLLAGLTVSLPVTPRYVATGVVALKTQGNEDFEISVLKVTSAEFLSMVIQDPRLDLYKRDRESMPIEKVIAKAREAVQISPVDQSKSAYRIDVTYSDRRGALGMANALITGLFQDHMNKMHDLVTAQQAERDRILETRIGELQARLAILEARVGVQPRKDPMPSVPLGPSEGHVRDSMELEVLDSPVARKEFPGTGMFMLTGGAIGLLTALPLARRKSLP